MIIDYEILKLIWWLFVGVLLIGFAITDGMDMGVGNLLPFVGKNDDERRLMINTVGPHWDGNQVWLITAGGVTFEPRTGGPRWHWHLTAVHPAGSAGIDTTAASASSCSEMARSSSVSQSISASTLAYRSSVRRYTFRLLPKVL